jgi:diguanylate cyclase (GGDEF)-like protein/PAS domain S-box-containing protein
MFHALNGLAELSDWLRLALAGVVGLTAIAAATGLLSRTTSARGAARLGWIAGGLVMLVCGTCAAYFITIGVESAPPTMAWRVSVLTAIALIVFATGIMAAAVDRRMSAKNLQLDTALNNMSHGLMMFDAASRVVLCNQRYLELYRLAPEAIRAGMSLRDVIEARIAAGTFSGDPATYCTNVVAAMTRRESLKRVAEMSDGRTIAVVSEPLADGGWVATHQDITEEKRREDSFRFLFENNPVPMWVWEHATHRFLAVNQAAVETYGYPREKFLTMTLGEIKRSPNWEAANAARRGDGRKLREGYLSQHLIADGSLIDVAIYGRSIEYEGRPASIVATIDVSERTRAENELRRTREFLDAVVENVPMTIVVKDARDLSYLLVNRAAEAQFGKNRGEIIGKTVSAVFPKQTADAIETRDREAIATRRGFFSEAHPVTTPTRGDRFHTSRRLPILDESGEPRYLLSVVEDVTERKHQEDELRHTRTFLDNVIENMPAMLLVKDARTLRYTLMNRAAEQVYGIASENVIGKTAPEVFPSQANAFIDSRDRALLEKGEMLVVDEQPFETPGNGLRLLSSKKILVRDEGGAPQYILSLAEDVTERKRAHDRIAHLTYNDPLTDLPNRNAFNLELASRIERASASGETFALVCVDLDRFKEVNDVFGHALGDATLREAARRFCEAADGAFAARLGGDEFALIVTDALLPSGVEAVAGALSRALASDIVIDEHRVHIGLSVGVAIFPNDGMDADTLLANADAALYRAKAEERGSIRFFEAVMDERLRDRRALQHELRTAIEDGQLVLHYQPQARISGEIIGFEALVRWQHPTRGIVQPSTFIPLAEESGLIVSLSEWILREACREAASWPRPIQVAINVSPIQFRHGDLPSLVHEILLETGLSPHRLELEVTEGALIDDFSRALSILLRLKTLGVRIAMDDFGTGYSSLSYLQAFPFDKIKIDRTFIANLADNRHSSAIVRAVIGLGRGMHIPVVAEGVETAEQLAFLARESCDEVQGFHIGRPAPIDQYAAVVGRKAAQPALRLIRA